MLAIGRLLSLLFLFYQQRKNFLFIALQMMNNKIDQMLENFLVKTISFHSKKTEVNQHFQIHLNVQ